MSKQGHLIGLSLLVMLLLLPSSAVAAPAAVNSRSPFGAVLDQLLAMVNSFLFPSAEAIDGRCSRPVGVPARGERWGHTFRHRPVGCAGSFR
jgi:hypothetical protein